VKIQQAFFLLLAILSLSANAQFQEGAPQGYGLAGLANGDIWAAYQNQAGLASIEGVSAGVSYTNSFLIPELGTGAVAVAVPFKKQTFAISVRSFGYSLYNEGKYGLSYARLLGENLRIGIQFNYQTLKIGEGYGNQNVFTVEGGVQYDVGEHVTLSAHVYNPNQSKVNDFEDERLPAIIRAGVRYTFNERLFAAADFWKQIDQDPQLHAGLEYWVHPIVALRAGISTAHFQSHFGLGVKAGQFQVDLSTAYHSILGYSPQIALSFHGK
jgi:hypothetical protein